MDDSELLARLESGTLPPAEFNHVTHVRAAWLFLRREPLAPAAHRFAATLQGYVIKLGAQGKFHLTLTLAFMHLIHDRMQEGEGWAQFRARNQDLFANAAALIARHYSPPQLGAGRGQFTEPDLAPLP